MVMDDDTIKKMQDEDEMPSMPDMSNMYTPDDPVYRERHALAQELQLQSALEGFVLLKNTGVLPLTGNIKLNVFGRHAGLYFNKELCEKYGVSLNTELHNSGFHAKVCGNVVIWPLNRI